jgi:hypothetical protein
VWVWVVAAVVLYTLYQHYKGTGSSAAAAVTPSPAVQSSGATQGDAGAGNAAGQLPSDLLSQLGALGVHDAYNTYTYSPIDSHDFSSSYTAPAGNVYNINNTNPNAYQPVTGSGSASTPPPFSFNASGGNPLGNVSAAPFDIPARGAGLGAAYAQGLAAQSAAALAAGRNQRLGI